MTAFAGSLVLALRVGGVGWLWALASESRGSTRLANDWFDRLGRTVVLGLLLNLLPALALASIQAWSPIADWGAWAILVVVAGLRLKRRGGPWVPSAGHGAAALLVLWLLASIPFWAPPRSEWLAGGWDPGIYQNNAVVIAREHGLQGRPDSIFSQMSPEERALFVRSTETYQEILPAVPVREDGSLPLYFFHLTSLCGAWLLRMGGLGMLWRLPAILSFWGVLPMLALCTLAGMGGWRRWVVLGVWLLSPMWWYHQAIPTTEMLYLFLLMGGALLYIHAALRGSRIPLGAMACLFAATVNHLNAAVLVGLLLVVAAWAEGRAAKPGRVARIVLAYAAIGLAIVWSWRYAGITILRLEEQDDAISVILTLFGLAAVAAPWLAWRPGPAPVRKGMARIAGVGGIMGGVLLALVALGSSMEPIRSALLQVAREWPWVGTPLAYFVRVVPFHGALGVAWAGLGLAWLFLPGHTAWRGLRLLAVALGLVCLAIFLRPGIAPIYPWALRRVVVFWVPLVASMQAFALVRAVEVLRHRGGRWRYAWLLVFVPAVVEAISISAAARRVGDYPGFGTLLAGLEQVMGPDDVVVADDARWGTPLLLAGGRDVISGRPLRRSADPEFHRRFMEALQRLRVQNDRRWLWLTSTESGLAHFPVRIGATPLPDGEFEYAYATINHSSRAQSYQTRPHQRRLRLFEWDGSFELGEPAGEEDDEDHED